MKKAMIAICLVFAMASSPAVWAGENCEHGSKTVFDRSGRVASTGPGAFCSKSDCKMCAFKPSKDHAEQQGSEKKGCCGSK